MSAMTYADLCRLDSDTLYEVALHVSGGPEETEYLEHVLQGACEATPDADERRECRRDLLPWVWARLTPALREMLPAALDEWERDRRERNRQDSERTSVLHRTHHLITRLGLAKVATLYLSREKTEIIVVWTGGSDVPPILRPIIGRHLIADLGRLVRVALTKVKQAALS